MTSTSLSLISCLIICIFLPSCETDGGHNTGDPGFRMTFSDGTSIRENDINYYDSSTCFLFLKNNLQTGPGVSDFDVYVGDDLIYSGCIQSCLLSTLPPLPYFVSDCFLYGGDILQIGYLGENVDRRKDPEIISAFEKSGKLLHGLSCRIDSLKVFPSGDHSGVNCTVTVGNNDGFGYYIPDAGKMGDLKFCYFTGGLSFMNTGSGTGSFLRWSVALTDWNDLTMQDLTLLGAGEQISFTFTSSDYYMIVPGTYEARFRYSGPGMSQDYITLEKENGRIWIGETYAVANQVVAGEDTP